MASPARLGLSLSGLRRRYESSETADRVAPVGRRRRADLMGCDEGPLEEAGEEIDDAVDDVEDKLD